jgi:hypothetical protein
MLQRGKSMALIAPLGSIPRKILIAASCVLACAWVQAPYALAQHGGHAGGGHVGGGGHFTGGGRIAAPHASAGPASHAAGARSQLGFHQRPILIHRRIFVPAPFFRFRRGFNSPWFLNCSPIGQWWQFGCNDLFVTGYGFENYVTMPVYENLPYTYSSEPRELVRLYLKDGTVYSVTDYWFVNNEVHFILPEDEGSKSGEGVIGLDQLDLQRTSDVNTRRGFRVVMRDEPLEQYLRNHPDTNPPLLQPPQKN